LLIGDLELVPDAWPAPPNLTYIDLVGSGMEPEWQVRTFEGVETSDSALWSRSRKGEADAFALLFERHADAIYNYCFRRIGSWSVAEDLLSVVFLEAWRRREKELPPGKVLPWLYGIATNVVRNQRRSQRRYARALARMPAPQPEEDFAARADERLEDEPNMQQLLAVVRRLPQREQDVFVLCAWSDLSYADAALALGIPVGTVRSRLWRARARLRELVPGVGHEEDESREPITDVCQR
jgi:RNA polymerase sigma factor (sigma-70 family)